MCHIVIALCMYSKYEYSHHFKFNNEDIFLGGDLCECIVKNKGIFIADSYLFCISISVTEFERMILWFVIGNWMVIPEPTQQLFKSVYVWAPLPFLKFHFTCETESPWPLHFKHSRWWKRWSRAKVASHYAWGTNKVCECKMDVKSTWIPTWHQMDHVSWSLGLFSKTTSWR